MLRRLLVLLLCLALPLQAQAALFPAQAVCPMEAQIQEQLASGELSIADLPDCCNDAETIAETGKTCKAGQECKAPASFVAPATPASRPAFDCADPPHYRASRPPSGWVAEPWRPPAAR